MRHYNPPTAGFDLPVTECSSACTCFGRIPALGDGAAKAAESEGPMRIRPKLWMVLSLSLGPGVPASARPFGDDSRGMEAWATVRVYDLAHVDVPILERAKQTAEHVFWSVLLVDSSRRKCARNLERRWNL
jgi:hypothetical protein